MSEIIKPSWTVNPNEAFYNGPKGSNFYIAEIYANSEALQKDLDLLNNSPIPVGAYVMISYGGTEDTSAYQNEKVIDGTNLNSSIWQKQILTKDKINSYNEGKTIFIAATPKSSEKWCYVFITSSQGEAGKGLNIIDTFNVDTETPGPQGVTDWWLNNTGLENFNNQDTLDEALKNVFNNYYKNSANSVSFAKVNDTIIGNFYIYKTFKEGEENNEKIYMSVYYICNNVTAQTYYLSKISGYYTPPRELTSINGFEYNELSDSLRLGKSYNNSNTPKNQQIIIGSNQFSSDTEGAILIGQNVKPESDTLFAIKVDPTGTKENNLLEVKETKDINNNTKYSLLLNDMVVGDTANSLTELARQIEILKQLPVIKPYFTDTGERRYYPQSEPFTRQFVSLSGQVQTIKKPAEGNDDIIIGETPIKIRIMQPSNLANKGYQLHIYKTLDQTTLTDCTLEDDNFVSDNYYSSDNVTLFFGYQESKENNSYSCEWLKTKVNWTIDGYNCTTTNSTSTIFNTYNKVTNNQTNKTNNDDYGFDDEGHIYKYNNGKYQIDNTIVVNYKISTQYPVLQSFSDTTYRNPYSSSLETDKNSLLNEKNWKYSSTTWKLIELFIHSEEFVNYIKSKWSIGAFRPYSGNGNSGSAVIIAGKDKDRYYPQDTSYNSELEENGNNITFTKQPDISRMPVALFTFMLGYYNKDKFYLVKEANDIWWYHYKSGGKRYLSETYATQEYYNLTAYTSLNRKFDDDELSQIQNRAKIVVKRTRARNPSDENEYIYSLHKVFIPSQDEIEGKQYDILDLEKNIPNFVPNYYSTIVGARNTSLLCQLRTPGQSALSKEETSWIFYAPKEGYIVLGPVNAEELKRNDYTHADDRGYELGCHSTKKADCGLRMFCL